MKQHRLLIIGVLIVAAAWIGPLPELAERLFSAHMTMHMTVVAIAAPLIALGLAGGDRDPARRFSGLFSPIPASLLEFIVVWTWHAPTLHHAARHHAAVFLAEQATFLFCGVFLWLSVFGGDTDRRHIRRASGLIGLLLTSMHMTLLGALLALASRPLYHDTTGLSVLTSLQDQHLGGAIMLVIGGLVYLAGGLWIMAELLKQQEVS
jgi:putative membrane protein